MPNPNPAKGPGRPKGSRNKITIEIRELAQQHAPAALRELVRLVKHAKSEAARVAAIKEVLDRAYGKSVQPISGTEEGPPIKIEVTDAERALALMKLLAKGKGG